MMTSSAHKFSVYPFHLIGLHAAVLEESDVFTLTLTLTLTLIGITQEQWDNYEDTGSKDFDDYIAAYPQDEGH